MTDELRQLYYLRHALQGLAAFTAIEDFADIAAALDEYAALLWRALR